MEILFTFLYFMSHTVPIYIHLQIPIPIRLLAKKISDKREKSYTNFTQKLSHVEHFIININIFYHAYTQLSLNNIYSFCTKLIDFTIKSSYTYTPNILMKLYGKCIHTRPSMPHYNQSQINKTRMRKLKTNYNSMEICVLVLVPPTVYIYSSTSLYTYIYILIYT